MGGKVQVGRQAEMWKENGGRKDCVQEAGRCVAGEGRCETGTCRRWWQRRHTGTPHTAACMYTRGKEEERTRWCGSTHGTRAQGGRQAGKGGERMHRNNAIKMKKGRQACVCGAGKGVAGI